MDRNVLRASSLAACAAALALAASASAGGKLPDHAKYDRLLRKYGTAHGVDYGAWHRHDADRIALKTYITQMENADLAALSDSSARNAALAFWINVYNAATLDLVITDYPVKSIKGLGGGAGSPWRRSVFLAGGHARCLDDIENDVIRPTFHDPRVHFALNCAAKSCPPLRGGAYVADSVDVQLEEQTKAFLSSDVVEVLRENPPKIRVPKIFDWYEKDFGGSETAVAAWLKPYVPALAAIPDTAKVDLKYDDYDWSLNDVTH
jgi:Protein of unknown function, DUF547